MSMTSEWLAFMCFGIGIFVVGMLWARKERRDHAQSSSRLGGSEPALAVLGQPGTQLSDLQQLTAAATVSFERRESQLEGTYAHIMHRLQSLTQAEEAASSGGARLQKDFERLLGSLQQLTDDATASFKHRESELEEAHKLLLYQLRELADDAKASFEKRERELVEGYAHLFHRLEELAESAGHRLPARAP